MDAELQTPNSEHSINMEENKMGYKVIVAGATGAVGTQMIQGLEERKFPVDEIKFLASSRSAGKKLKFNGADVTVEELKEDSFAGFQIALFSAGGDRSLQYAPASAKAGCVVVDNSSAFRMEKDVPLVVPEVNPEAAKEHKGIIANPNCSTIQMVHALKPLHDAAQIKRVVVSTYQAVSGAGLRAIEELKNSATALVNGTEEPKAVKFAQPMGFNCLPQIDTFLDNGYTKEEWKMVVETKKIMCDDSIEVSPTAVRVPVYHGHSESVNIEFARDLSPEDARDLLSSFPGIIVIDNLAKNEWPHPRMAAGRDETFVGRIRRDPSQANTLNMWIVSDNIRKGAATNAIQIAELLVERQWL